MRQLLWALPVVLAASGCAARVFYPPSGASTPAPDAAQIWQQVTERCRGAQRYAAEVRVDGWVGARDQRIASTLTGAVTRSDDVFLELRMLGSLVFQLGGQQGQSTFVLFPEARVLRGSTRTIVGALTGLEWGATELLDVFSGCVASPSGEVTGERTGSFLRVALGPGGEAWLRQRDGRWQVHAARVQDWLIEYRMYEGVWPTLVRVTSSGQTPLDVQFTLGKMSVNTDLPPEIFTITVPSHFVPMTMEELRQLGPLRARPPSTQHPSTEHPSTEHPEHRAPEHRAP